MPKSAFMPLAMATLTETVPTGAEWIYEVKLDGYRIEAIIDPQGIQLLTRNGNDWSHRFPAVCDALRSLHTTNAVLDGEVVVLNAKGISSFQALQQMLESADRSSLRRMRYYVFDLLVLDGHTLTGLPLDDRVEVLRALLKSRPPRSIIRPVQRLYPRNGDLLAQACAAGQEGVISKRRNASYAHGRGQAWVKTKCLQRQEFVVVGYTAPKGAREAFGALLLGVYDGDQLLYAGKVGTGFDQRTLHTIYSKLNPQKRQRSALTIPPAGKLATDVQWVHPTLVAEVAFTEWTADGLLRHPVFQGLREDKVPHDVRREQL